MVILENIKEPNEQKERLYQPKEVSEITGIETDLLRKYTDFFNIQTEWTRPGRKGHRRYTKKNIEELISIRDKIKNQGWTWDQVLAWRNGEVDTFMSHQEKSNLEKKMDQLFEELRYTNEKLKLQEEFNIALIQKLEELSRKLIESEQRNAALQNYIENSLQERDRKLLESIRQIQEQKQKPKRKGIFRFFN